MLLDPSELAQLQSIGQSGMSGTAMILTRITVETDDGQESQWATVGDEVPCWVYEITSSGTALHAIAGAVDLVELFTIRLPVGSPVASGDQLAVGSKVYMVEHTNDEDTYPVWLTCTCRHLV